MFKKIIFSVISIVVMTSINRVALSSTIKITNPLQIVLGDIFIATSVPSIQYTIKGHDLIRLESGSNTLAPVGQCKFISLVPCQKTLLQSGRNGILNVVDQNTSQMIMQPVGQSDIPLATINIMRKKDPTYNREDIIFDLFYSVPDQKTGKLQKNEFKLYFSIDMFNSMLPTLLKGNLLNNDKNKIVWYKLNIIFNPQGIALNNSSLATTKEPNPSEINPIDIYSIDVVYIPRPGGKHVKTWTSFLPISYDVENLSRFDTNFQKASDKFITNDGWIYSE